MANVDSAFGFVPVGGLDGSPYNGATIRCAILAAQSEATFIGDAVRITGTGTAEGIPAVEQLAAAEDLAFGVIVAFEPDPATSLEDQYRKASTLRYCHVAPALDNLFMVQYDGTFAITEIGEANDIVVGSGNTTTGISTMQLGATGGDQFQVLAALQAPDNEVGANTRVVGRFITSVLRSTTPV